MIGGQGEKKTLRMMAQYAEMANFTSTFDELPRKLEVLARIARTWTEDPSTINKTCLTSVLQGSSMEDAVAMRNAFLLARGLDYDALDDATRALVAGRLIVGDADSVGEQYPGDHRPRDRRRLRQPAGERPRPRGGHGDRGQPGQGGGLTP